MKHKLVLELSTPELNALMVAVECYAGSDLDDPPPRGNAFMDAALESESDTPWRLECLRRPYRAMAASWPFKDTEANAGFFSEDELKRVELLCRIRAQRTGREVTHV
jgi:hypothetical protein